MAAFRQLAQRAGCTAAYIEHALTAAEADAAFRACAALPWRVETDAFGPQSRPTYYVGDKDCTFSYVGLRLPPQPWTPELLEMRARVAAAIERPAEALTGVLLNNYPAGSGSIPWHYDEVRAHGAENLIATLSLGGPRRFRLRPRDGSGDAYVEVEMTPGSVVMMAGATQDHYEHELPLRDGDPPRISLTFRSIVPGFEDALATANDLCVEDAKPR